MATKFWRPQAGAIPHIVTVTITGTPVAADTVTVEINNSSLTVTVGTLVATTDVANALAAAWSALTATANLVDDESRNVGGAQLPEHSTITAVAYSNTVVLTAKVPGVPFVAAVAKVGTVAIAQATTQTATGPNHADSADNWSGGTLPAAADTIVFDAGNVSCLYGLAYFRDATLDLGVRITGDFLGSIGLPWWNPAGYQEYRDRFFELYDTLGLRSLDVVAGVNGGTGGTSQVLRFDAQGQVWDEIRVLGGMGSAASSGASRLEVHGGSVDLLSVDEGWVVIDPDDAQQSAGMTVDKVVIGKADGSNVNPRVSIGRLALWAAGDTPLDVLGGLVEIHNVLDPGTAEGLPLTISGGIVKVLADGDINVVTVKGGTFVWVGLGTQQGAMEVWGDGTVDLAWDGRLKTYGTVTAHRGATFRLGRQLPTITPTGCFLEDINVSR